MFGLGNNRIFYYGVLEHGSIQIGRLNWVLNNLKNFRQFFFWKAREKTNSLLKYNLFWNKYSDYVIFT